MDCYAGQFAQYEGLTVNASEAINTAGGDVMRNSGKEVAVDSPEARKGLQTLVDAFKDGTIPKAGITYKEEEGRRSFQQGKLLFLRNWPYVYNLAAKPGPDSKIVGKFGVAPLPSYDASKPGASSLGGHNLALSKFSKNKATARDWIKFMQSAETQRKITADMGLAPVLENLYDDAELAKDKPYLPVLKQSILNAKVRPVTPNYNAVTLAIQKHSYAALQGQKSVDQAIADMKAELEQAAKRG
jgi:multiple sugar transport system substrate-binding protein